MAKDEYVVRAGVSFDDPERKVFPFGLRWLEIGGVRIPPCGLQSITSRNADGEFGSVEILLGGCRVEMVDANTPPAASPIDWRALLVRYMKASRAEPFTGTLEEVAAIRLAQHEAAAR